jgi:maltose alpha-D-glucosyltransferase/alpha-amylase
LPLWLNVHFTNSEAQLYFLPLSLVWGEDGDRLKELSDAVLAKVKQRARVGILCDAFVDRHFCQTLIHAMGNNRQIPLVNGQLSFSATRAYPKLVSDLDELAMSSPSAKGSNTAVILGNHLFLKGYRRLQSGLNPELEMGRFLTEASPFSHIAPLAGAVEFNCSGKPPMALALLQACMANQGDGWTYTLEYLDHFLDELRLAPTATRQSLIKSAAGGYLNLMAILGQRTGELHLALAKHTGNAAFDPEPIAPADLSQWREQILREAMSTLERLTQVRADLPERTQRLVDQLLTEKVRLLGYLADPSPKIVEALKTRYHGDYHLGQVLVTQGDFSIIDFEGEPARPLGERCLKRSPLKDVSGMLRSLHYAANAAIQGLVIEQPEKACVLQPYVQAWAQQASSAFLNGYIRTVRDNAIYPCDTTHAHKLIGLFYLEKLFYELRYELVHRPNWVDIPLSDLVKFAHAGYSMGNP